MKEIFAKLTFKNAIALIVIVGTYWVLFILTKHAIPAENRDLFNVLAGIVFNATIGRVMRAFYPEKEEKTAAPKQH